MPSISNDVIALLQYLLPGFIVAGVIYVLTPHERPSQFERIVEALIYSMTVNLFVGLEKKLLLFLGNWVTLGKMDTDSETLLSLTTAAFMGLFISYLWNKDHLHRLFRALRISKKSSHPSGWYAAFNRDPTYIILHIKGERRLYGWPLWWPSSGEKDHFHMTNCAWLDDELGTIDLPQEFLIKASDIEWVEILPKERL